MIEPAFTYRAIVQGVYDGDTITVDLDLGLWTWRKGEKLRLFGIDTPELRGPERDEGLAVRDWLREQIPIGSEIVVETIRDKSGKFGRLLAVIWKEGRNINEELVNSGRADVYLP